MQGATVTYTASASDAGSGVSMSSFLPASGSTFAPGTTTVSASATDAADNTTTGSFTVTVGTALENWKLTNLGDANAPDLGDPDGDGLTTLVGYALMLSPSTPSTMPLVDFVGQGTEMKMRIFVYRDTTHREVTIEVQATDSLTGTWATLATSTLGAPFSGPGYVGGDNAIPVVKTVEIRDTATAGSSPTRYLRVRVTR